MISPLRRSGLTVLLMLWTVLASSVFAANVVLSLRSQPPTPTAAHSDRQAPNYGGDKQSSAEAITPPGIGEHASGEQPEDRHGTTADWWMVVLTFLGFIATLWLVVIAGQQFRTQTNQTNDALRYASDGLEETRRAAAAADRAEASQSAHNEAVLLRVEQMASAAAASAAAATASVALAKTQQRAWVGVAAMDVEIPTSPDLQGVVTVWLINSGATPALHLRMGTCVHRTTGSIDFPRVLESRPVTWANEAEAAAILLPDVKIKNLTRLDVRDPGINAALLGGTAQMCIYGAIEYSDVFGTPHQTTFAYKWNAATVSVDAIPGHNNAN